VENNIETTLEAIDNQIKDDEIITLNEIKKYLDKNPDSEVAKKAEKSLNNLKDKTSIKIETLKQRIVFDSLVLKPWIEKQKEKIWDNALKVWVNPLAFALLLNGETEWNQWRSSTWAVWWWQFTQVAVDDINSTKNIDWFSIVDGKLTKEKYSKLSDDFQIYLSAYHFKNKYDMIKKTWANRSDAIVAYNIWQGFYTWIKNEKKIDKLAWWQAYWNEYKKWNFSEDMLENVPNKIKVQYLKNKNDSKIKKRILAINLAKKYYLWKNIDNKNLISSLSYSPVWTWEVPESVKKDFDKIVENVNPEIKERWKSVWWIWQLSITDVLWFMYWWLNIFWAVMDWISWNWWDALTKWLIAYTWMKNISREVWWNLDDWKDKIENISERYSDKTSNLKWILEKIYNWENWNTKEKLINSLFGKDDLSGGDRYKRVEKIWWIFKKVNFDNIANIKVDNNWKAVEESVSSAIDMKIVSSDMKWPILNILWVLKTLNVHNIDEFKWVIEYVTWNYSPSWFDKIRNLVDMF